jgi:NADPH:quinone reductase
MKAVRYDRFGGIEQLYVADVPEPAPGPGEVLVRVEAGALNPGALPALDGSSYTPGRDLAGEVVAVGEGVLNAAARDTVIGWM